MIVAKSDKGLSRIGWIIAVIVILILTVIIFFVGNDTTKKSQTSKFESDINDVQNSGNAENEKITSNTEKKISEVVQVGDYIEYSGATDNSYILREDLTGYSIENGKVLTPVNVNWRVWKVENDGTVLIIPEKPVNNFYLKGATGFVNSVDVINDVCKIYANEKYGVSSNDIRSLAIEDLEDVSIDFTTIKDNFQKDNTSYPQYGQTNLEYYGTSYTSGIFYTESDGVTINKEGIIASVNNPVVIKQTCYRIDRPTWKSIENNKFSGITYGNLIDNTHSWFASTCTDLSSTGVCFSVYSGCSSSVYALGLYNNVTDFAKDSGGVRPLVSLSSTLEIDVSDTTKDGSSPEKAWRIK